MTFAPTPGAQPFALSAADKVEFHFRPGPDDQAAVFFKVDAGVARLSGLFARIAGDKPISISWDSLLSKISAFKGANWPEAVRAWTTAGGRMTVRQAGITAGEVAPQQIVEVVGDHRRNHRGARQAMSCSRTEYCAPSTSSR